MGLAKMASNKIMKSVEVDDIIMSGLRSKDPKAQRAAKKMYEAQQEGDILTELDINHQLRTGRANSVKKSLGDKYLREGDDIFHGKTTSDVDNRGIKGNVRGKNARYIKSLEKL